MARVRLKWFGDDIKKRMIRASEIGINRTMALAVTQAKSDHGGWENVTGTAERSIRIQNPAQTLHDFTFGVWGSAQVEYFIWLEIGTALREGYHTLRRAAVATYPFLPKLINRAYGELR